jgi:lipopolysaccharide heptosyltransferase II
MVDNPHCYFPTFDRCADFSHRGFCAFYLYAILSTEDASHEEPSRFSLDAAMKDLFSSFLIINPFGIGDVLFSTPLIRNVKERFPDARIVYLCNKRAHFVVKNNPLVDKVVLYERDEFAAVKERSRLAWMKKYFQFISSLREEHIEISLDLSLNSQFAFFTWAAGIPVRIGLDYKRRGRLLTTKVKIDGFLDKHVIDYYLDLLNPLNVPIRTRTMEIFIEDQACRWADRFMADRNIEPHEAIIGIAPLGGEAFGSQSYRKQWPKEKFSHLINRLIQERNARVLLFAGPKEKGGIAEILSHVKEKGRCHDTTGCSLEEMAALIEKCTVFIGNDTGPLRVADALKKKVVALFGPVDERVYGLYPEDFSRHRLLVKDVSCRPCYLRFRLPPCEYGIECLHGVSVEEVMAAVTSLTNPR